MVNTTSSVEPVLGEPVPMIPRMIFVDSLVAVIAPGVDTSKTGA